MTLKRIFVLPGRIRDNRGRSAEDQNTVIVIEYGRTVVHAVSVDILGPSRVVYDAVKGRVWVETEANLQVEKSGDFVPTEPAPPDIDFCSCCHEHTEFALINGELLSVCCGTLPISVD